MIGCAKAFCAQAPAMPPEPPRPLNPEAPSLGRPKTSFWELHSAKGNSHPAANHISYAPWLRKAAQAVFRPGPALSIGQSRAVLSLAPWALLLCWGSPAPKTHSPRVLLRGEAGLGARRASAPRPQPYTLSQLGRSAPRPHHSDGPKRASGAAFCKGKLSLGSTPQPHLASAQEIIRSCFRPRPSAFHRAKLSWAALGSLGPAALLGSRRPKPTPHWFSFFGKQDWAPKSLLRPGPSHAP